MLDRILYWTAGHPFLTQRLCRAIVEKGKILSLQIVDELVDTLFLTTRAREQDDNLAFVRSQLLAFTDEKERAALLDLYQRVHSGKRVYDDKSHKLISILRLSGAVKSDAGVLRVRNRVYSYVFGAAWIIEHMPGAEKRRQRAAYLKGILRAIFVSSGILAPTIVFAVIAFVQFRQAREAKGRADIAATHAREEANWANEERGRTERISYSADMNIVRHAYEDGDYRQAISLLRAHQPVANREDLRGFEWYYYWRLLHRDLYTFRQESKSIVFSVAFSPNGRILASADGDGVIKLWDVKSHRQIKSFRNRSHAEITCVVFVPGRENVLAAASLDGTVHL